MYYQPLSLFDISADVVEQHKLPTIELPKTVVERLNEKEALPSGWYYVKNDDDGFNEKTNVAIDRYHFEFDPEEIKDEEMLELFDEVPLTDFEYRVFCIGDDFVFKDELMEYILKLKYKINSAFNKPWKYSVKRVSKKNKSVNNRLIKKQRKQVIISQTKI
ncbi:hypothetical protein Hesp116 [Hemileuca sp. nucleopolyhedrovirus]|uniref:Uncharacterized protein n=1 Tax=Hemileuca sp. nucleopolyhedrovirus TaxID=1367203 RepID=S5MQC2_9ABAC|nr:hypothetical protein Hesp116 [Hemileuca sp. nucleopolyhedrovirus]AGR56868.1 hypothetical protein Hesp116 [Hemileuca sp. nucleopolyhedrovirus]